MRVSCVWTHNRDMARAFLRYGGSRENLFHRDNEREDFFTNVQERRIKTFSRDSLSHCGHSLCDLSKEAIQRAALS